MRYGVLVVVTSLLLVLVAFAGCIDRISDLIDPEERDPEEPNKRLEGVRGQFFLGGSCYYGDSSVNHPVNPLCIQVHVDPLEIKCDPAQLWVIDPDDPQNRSGKRFENLEEARTAQEGVEKPNDAYLHCVIEFRWSFSVETLMPESEFHVTHKSDFHHFEDSCEIPINSKCGFEFSYKANLTAYQDKEGDFYEGAGEVKIERMEHSVVDWYQSRMVYEVEYSLIVG